MKRVALVTPWFGERATGGAELHARELARRLSAHDDVTVLTSTVASFHDNWAADGLRPGTSNADGYRVRRFAVDGRDVARFDQVNGELLASEPAARRRFQARDAQTAPFVDESINSRALENHLRGATDYDAVLFLPYLYGITVRGIAAYPGRAHLMPCLHDESYAHVPAIRRAFHRAATLLFISEGEAELALRLLGPGVLHKSHVVGGGVEPLAAAPLRPPAAPAGDFVVYVGRRDVTKNVDLLVAAFARYRAAGGRLELVLAGAGATPYAGDGVTDLGYITEGEKAWLVRNCRALLLPSTNESYSRVIMEAWAFERPVVVSAACLATAFAVERSGGGWTASDLAGWALRLAELERASESELLAMGRRGEQYARVHADWDLAVERLRAAVGLAEPPRNGRRARIDQVLPTLDYADAVSDYTRYLRDTIRALGHESTIFAERAATAVAADMTPFDAAQVAAADAVIYHHSIAADVTEAVARLPGRRALIYHNITPGHLLHDYDRQLAALVDRGRDQMGDIIGRFDLYVADSDYNAAELLSLGAPAVRTVPVAVDLRRFDAEPDAALTARERTGVRWLFVGRITPSKGIDALLDAFAAFAAAEPAAELDVVGKYEPEQRYFRELTASVRRNGLDARVRFRGQVSEPELHAFYRGADVFVTLSEHEGFCVPLVEAMFFGLPIVAKATSAIPETLGEAGLLLDPAGDRFDIAAAVRIVLRDDAVREVVLRAQQRRRGYFEPRVARRRVEEMLQELLP